ncbi:serine/threonine-protein kinase MARK1-like isoform X4 [Haliotis cracherodii]|uniref:serine/threonine-protein kinase MARK1-like isoform X4 n=1 Tax=Haliotis cracherodii TaxID=6455 RepID=UPI0039E9FA03
MGKKIQCIGRYVMNGQTLGKGNFARVELATHSVTECKVAIKLIETRRIKEEYLRQNMHREARILGQLRHPNIIRLYETLKASSLYCLVTEYASGGELLAYIKMHKDYRLSEDKSRTFVRQMVSAIHYLHERGVAHRDLKMENIMLDEKKKNIKICDFGLSNTFAKDELMKTHCGSPEYAAPELFNPKESYGPGIDIWSMGIIMYAMMVGKLPFQTPYTDEYRRVKLLQQIEKGLGAEHYKEMAHLSQDAQDILSKMIEPKPANRLPLMDIEIHPWLTTSSKMPFFPFTNLPRDRNMKSQESVASVDEEEVIDELCSTLNVKREQVEKTVHESRSDEMSAMFNMLLHRKRVAQGLFDVDHTLKCEPPRKPNRKHRSKSAGRSDKEKEKGKDKSKDIKSDAPPSASGSGEHENKISSFDFLALCSTPTWLGPERRRSRRRSKSPGPHSPASTIGSLKRKKPESEKHGETLTVPGAQPKVEINEGAKVESDNTGSGNLLSPNSAYKTQTTTTTTNSVPPGRTHSLHRGGSLRLSKKRARSCGPAGKGKGPLQKSNSLDVPDTTVEVTPVLLETPKPSAIPRPAKLVLRDCYTAATPVKIKGAAATAGTNGPVTSVEVHFSDSSNPCSSIDLLKSSENSSTQVLSRLEVPGAELNLCKNLRLPPIEAAISEPSASACALNDIVRPKDRTGSNSNQLHVFQDKGPPKPLTVDNAYERPRTEGANAMQLGECDTMSTNDDSKFDFGGCPSSLESGVGERDLEQELTDMKLLEMEECDDRVDSTVELISGKSNPFTDNAALAALCSRPISSGSSRHDSPCSSRHMDSNSCINRNPDEIEVLDTCESAPCANRLSKRPGGSARSSIRSQKLKTPTTPSWMVFKTPIARIESFHSDDFEYYTSEQTPDKGEKVSLSSVSPSSVNTPTVPCFAYKLNLGKKKPPKLKNSKSKIEMISTKGIRNTADGGKGIPLQNSKMLEPVITDPLLSSGSDTEHHDDTNDKLLGSGKSKIHPMDMEDQESEVSGKGSKSSRGIANQKGHANAITKQPNQIQNSLGRNSKNLPSNDTKKKIGVKNSPWKKSFAQFLKRKRQTIRLPSNNNNNDCSPANQQQSARNGHAPNSPVGKTDPSGTEDRRTLTSSSAPVGNNIAESIELQSSPIPRSPSPTPRVFDFTLVTDSPKGKSCLLSWRACRECGVSDQSSEGESECNIPLEQNVNLSLKTMPEMNNIQDPTRNFTAYQFTHS